MEIKLKINEKDKEILNHNTIQSNKIIYSEEKSLLVSGNENKHIDFFDIRVNGK